MIVFDDLAGRDGRENDDDDGEDLHDGDTWVLLLGHQYSLHGAAFTSNLEGDT